MTDPQTAADAPVISRRAHPLALAVGWVVFSLGAILNSLVTMDLLGLAALGSRVSDGPDSRGLAPVSFFFLALVIVGGLIFASMLLVLRLTRGRPSILPGLALIAAGPAGWLIASVAIV